MSIHGLYIPSITRFHVFSFIELLYLYSVLKRLSVAYRLEAFCYNWEALPCTKEVLYMLVAISFVASFIVSVIAGIVANYISDKLNR